MRWVLVGLVAVTVAIASFFLIPGAKLELYAWLLGDRRMITCFTTEAEVAIPACTAMIESNPDEEQRARLLLARGVQYERSDRPQEAMRDYEESLRLDPDNPGASLPLTIHYLSGRNFGEAIRFFDQTLAQDGSNARAFYLRGYAKHKIGETQDAQADFARALELDPSVAKYGPYERDAAAGEQPAADAAAGRGDPE